MPAGPRPRTGTNPLARAAAPRPHKLRADLTDRLLLARLSLSPSNISDDPEQITVVATLPPNQTAFEYLGGAWRRERQERVRVVAKKVQICYQILASWIANPSRSRMRIRKRPRSGSRRSRRSRHYSCRTWVSFCRTRACFRKTTSGAHNMLIR